MLIESPQISSTVKPFKNGLTVEQVTKAKAILKQVSLKQLCKKNKVPYFTIANVLRDESPKIHLLHKILTAAKLEIESREKLLNSLPI